MGNIRLALLNIRKNIRNEKELKVSFIITVIGMAINNIAFLVIWYYFGKTIGELNGWSPMDVFGLYGYGTTVYGIVVSVFSGILDIPTYITTGNFDKYLLTPKNILVKVTTSKIHTSAFGDLLFGITCFIVFACNIKMNLLQGLLSIVLIILGSMMFYSFALFAMSISFYLMDGHNVSQGIYNIFVSNSLYHGGAFTGVLRFIFIYMVPALLIGAVPVEIIKNFSVTNLITLILVTIVWFIFSIMFFYKSLRRYESNNMFGFGS